MGRLCDRPTGQRGGARDIGHSDVYSLNLNRCLHCSSLACTSVIESSHDMAGSSERAQTELALRSPHGSGAVRSCPGMVLL